MVLQEVVPVSASAGTEGKEKNEGLSPTEDTRHQPIDRTYHPRVPFPQRLAWSELVQLEPRFERFLEILRRIYASSPFLEVLKSAPAQWKFLRELLSKTGASREASIASIGGSCSALLQRRSPSKLQDPGSFSIPCCIGDVQIERALCDLGASVSIMPLSLSARSCDYGTPHPPASLFSSRTAPSGVRWAPWRTFRSRWGIFWSRVTLSSLIWTIPFRHPSSWVVPFSRPQGL